MILVLVYGEKENGAREYMSCENDLFLLMKNVQTRKSLKNEEKENDRCVLYGFQRSKG